MSLNLINRIIFLCSLKCADHLKLLNIVKHFSSFVFYVTSLYFFHSMFLAYGNHLQSYFSASFSNWHLNAEIKQDLFLALTSSLVLCFPWMIPYSLMTSITMDMLKVSYLFSVGSISQAPYQYIPQLTWYCHLSCIICWRYQFLVN